jgi:hypothetical protein
MNEVQATGNMEVAGTVEAPTFFSGSTGFEGIDNDCVQTPFIKLAQRGTPEAIEGDPKYIEGLKPGMFFCPSSRKIYGPSPKFIIVKFFRSFNVFEGEGQESKFRGQMDSNEYKHNVEPYTTRVKSYAMKDGLRYVDARNFIVLVADNRDDGPMLLSMSSTGVSPSRKWLSAAMSVRVTRDGVIEVAPIWSSVWQVNVQLFQDPKGSYNQVSSVDRLGWVQRKDAQAIESLFSELKDAAITTDQETPVHQAEEAPVAQAPKPVEQEDVATRVANVLSGKPNASPSSVSDEDSLW